MTGWDDVGPLFAGLPWVLDRDSDEAPVRLPIGPGFREQVLAIRVCNPRLHEDAEDWLILLEPALPKRWHRLSPECLARVEELRKLYPRAEVTAVV